MVMSAKVLNSDFYFICPLIITDWAVFKENIEHKMWTEYSKYRSYSIKPLLASFLGATKAQDFPISCGLQFRGEIQNCGNTLFASFHNEKKSFVFIDKKGTQIQGIGGPYNLSSTVQLYVSPNKSHALYLLKLTTESISSLTEVENAAYVLHKTDHKQTPFICSDGINTGKNLRNIIEETLPHSGYSWESDSRFISATYVRLDASKYFDLKEVYNALIRLSLCKDQKYNIPESESKRVLPVFDNILTSSSREGFASIAISRDPEHELPFIVDFGATFEQSYLPLYLATTMVDQVYVGAIRNMEQIAMSVKEQDYLREARLVLVIPPSPYEHLNKQMEQILQGRNLNEKYETIRDSIISRKEQIEYERLQIEKENQRIALTKKEEDEKVRREIEEKREVRDRRINFLLGFIGIGQVVFAILQLLGASNVMGNSVANSQALNVASIVMLAIFAALIVYLLVRLFTEVRVKSDNTPCLTSSQKSSISNQRQIRHT